MNSIRTNHEIRNTNKMKIALAQFNIEWENKSANHAKSENFVSTASREGCDIIIFPEMFNTGFSMNISSITEDEDGETASILSRMAKQHSINIIAGYAVKGHDEVKGANIAVAYNRKGKRVARFAKLHPFSFAHEDLYFDAGINTVVFAVDDIMASIFICYDLRFPEVFRSVAKEVQAVFVLANWPSIRKEHWKTLLQARAIENQFFVIGVNRTGTDGNGISYPGASCVFDPLGNECCSGNEQEEFLACKINIFETGKVRSEYPFLKDMKPFNINLSSKS